MAKLRKQKANEWDKYISDDVLKIENTNDLLLTNSEILDKMGQDVRAKIRKVIYNNNKATDLKWLEYFPNTTHVTCRENAIKSIEWLQFVSKLVYLNIGKNQISDLTDIYFVEGTIAYLICDNNPLHEIDVNRLKNLVELDCSYCQLSTLIIRSLHNLASLRLSHNKVTQLVLVDVPGLYLLICHMNLIGNLILFGCINLLYIECTRNRITSISGIHLLIHLKKLWCSYNNIMTLEDVCHCTSLTTLVCSENKLTKLPDVSRLCLRIFEFDDYLIEKYQATYCHICLEIIDIALTTLVLDYICSYNFKDNKGIDKIVTPCQHTFHKKCFYKKYAVNKQCPRCLNSISSF